MYDNRVINNYYLVPTHNLDVGCISPKSKNPYPLFVLKAMNADIIDQKTARRFFHLVGLTFKVYGAGKLYILKILQILIKFKVSKCRVTYGLHV